jgi:tetratricopeptide (TPR) repeat protein
MKSKPLSKSRAAVSVRVEDLVIPTYLPAPPDKNPMFLEKRVYQGSSGKVYPLPFTDRIAEKPVDRKWKTIWIENEFIRAMVLPEIGGRIHVLQDKTNGYDVLYNQPVIKPALVGLAGPWISGGIEFNWPQHHRPATFLPVDFEIEKHADGSVTIWCSDHDPMCRMKGMHGVCLHPGRAYLELKVRAYNRTPFVQTFLWWANVATRVHEAYQSFFPPDVYYVADHARRSMSEYPLAQGHYYGVNYGERGRKGVPASEVPAQFIPPHCKTDSALRTSHSALPAYAPNDLSFYANIPVPTSYMCMGSREDFFGGYDYKAQAGIVHVANHHISPGKKQWTWGNHEFGYAWDRNLTDADARGEFGPYIEIMAGVYTDNQPDFSFLQPGETKTWSQFWYPIQQIGPAQHANLDAAISLTHRARKLRLGVSVTRKFSDAKIHLIAKGKSVQRFTRDLAPGVPFVAEVLLPAGLREIDLLLRVTDSAGNEIISYQPKPRVVGEVPPPATEPSAPADIASADELYITGLHLDQYRHATRCATLYWREALKRDPLDARCNNAMGLWHLKRGEFVVAEKFFRKSIERLTRRNSNPYDGEAYYNLGLCLRQLGRDDEAYDAFYKATWNQALAAAGYHAIAEIDCVRHNWTTAVEHLNRSLRFDMDNLRARNLKVIALQKLNRPAEADALLRETLSLDPLDWWARHLRGKTLGCDLQTHVDFAHDFARGGFFAEAIQLLISQIESQRDSSTQPRVARNELPWDVARPPHNPEGVAAPDDTTLSGLEDSSLRTQGSRYRANPGLKDTIPLGLPDQSWGALPLVYYTLGWLEQKRDNNGAALKYFHTAASLPPDYCFPARLEEIAILEAAMRANPRDARAPYYLGNLLYDRRRHDEAIQLWERSARLNPNFSVVWRNLGIGYFNIRNQPAKARAAYDRAFKANPADARLLYERDQLWKRLGAKPAQRLRELERHRKLVQQRDDLSVELCALYNQTGKHEQALALVSTRNFQPWEGGEGGPLGQWVRSHLALGRTALYSCSSRRESALTSLEWSGLTSAATSIEFQNGLSHFQAALTAPKNLGEAKHLLANQSDIHYWLGCACAAAGDQPTARRYWSAAANFKGDFQEMSVRAFSEMTYYSAQAWDKLGQRNKAKKLFRDLLAYAQQLQKARAKIDYFATSLPTMLLFDDDLQFRQETTALFLQAQAQLGLGYKARARALLQTVLRRDPNHALAADFLRGLAS